MSKKNVLLLCGGGASEHEISLISAGFLAETLKKSPDFNTFLVEIGKDSVWRNQNQEQVELNFHKELVSSKEKNIIHAAIPCFHGFPGETGDIQSFFELIGLPYIGCDSEASKLCFNKISTKLWFDALKIPNTEYLFLTDNSQESLKKATTFCDQYQQVFIKAASQGSSVGCYKITDKKELHLKINQAFNYSESVLIERAVKGRELEVSVYQWRDEIRVSAPGEILAPTEDFYSYEEKYSQKSKTQTLVRAPDISEKTREQIKEYAKKAFLGLHLRHLSRVDFFLENNKIYLNEINTFPGLTPISMFPKMMEENGDSFSEFLSQVLKTIAP